MAHLVHMCWPLSWGLHQLGHSFATFDTYAPSCTKKFFTVPSGSQITFVLDESHWHHINSLHICSLYLHQRVPQFAWKYPGNSPSPLPGDGNLATLSPAFHTEGRRPLMWVIASEVGSGGFLFFYGARLCWLWLKWGWWWEFLRWSVGRRIQPYPPPPPRAQEPPCARTNPWFRGQILASLFLPG